MLRTIVLTAITLLATSQTARADELTVAASVTLGGASAVTFTTIDLTTEMPTTSKKLKRYGAIEFGVNGAFALVNTYFAATTNIEVSPGQHNRAPNVVLGLMAAWNAGLAVHGGYLYYKGEKRAAEKRAEKRSRVTEKRSRVSMFGPAVVSDGVSMGAGAMLGGSF